MLYSSLARLLLAGALLSGLQSVALAQSPAFTVTRLVLVNSATQKDVRQLSPGDTINLATDGSALNLRAEVNGTPGCVSFALDGKFVRHENVAPYAFAADDSGKYRAWTPVVGTHTVRAVPYQSRDGSGQAGAAFQLTFKVTNSLTAPSAPVADAIVSTGAVTKLTLVNTTTQAAIRSLAAGDTINLANDGSALSVRADVSGTVKSVAFVLDGALTSTENIAPYSIKGDDSGKLRKWTPTVGTHTLRVTPYSLADRKGTPGAAMEVAFTVVQTGSVTPTPTPSPVEPAPTPVPSVPAPVERLSSDLYDADGELILPLYHEFATNFGKDSMESRFGPSFLDLSPNAADDRPTLFQPPSIKRVSGYIRTNPYELGGPPVTDGDYWSESGQVAYVPDDAADPGLDRIQVYAYYDRVFATSPRLDWASGKPHPDLQTREPYYATLFGQLPKYPIAMVRSYGMQCSEALVLYKGGYLAVAGTQTSRTGSERPYPGFKFPANKVPTNIAITTSNEFALVTVWDTTEKKGQLAVIALEGRYLKFHTWPYMAMPNQGSWSAFKLLGYVDLPMAMPSAVSAASNSWWSGPSQTGNLVLSQLDLAKEDHRSKIYAGAWSGTVAKGGYAIVSSKFDNKVAIVDLTPLFSYVRESYLSSATSFKQTMAARGTGDSNFPQAFAVRPSSTPRVVWQADIAKPNTVLAGIKMDRWTKDYYKAYVASEDGTISIIDTTPLMKRNTWEKLGSLRIAGTFNVGRNPVSMCFTRRGEGTLPLLPMLSDGTQSNPDPLNNIFYIAVRGDRKVVAAVTYGGEGAVYRTIKDKRMGDPVAVSTAFRGPMLSVADFRGKKLVGFRVGKINDLRNNKVFGCGADGKAQFEFAGEVPFAGNPFLINSTNVN